MRLFTIWDKKANCSNGPFRSETRETACREVSVGLTEDNPMTKYTDDFTIYEIGSYDIYLMEIYPTKPAVQVAEVSTLLPKETI